MRNALAAHRANSRRNGNPGSYTNAAAVANAPSYEHTRANSHAHSYDRRLARCPRT